ncbi:NADH-quinone oxidoreductase subunit E [Dehalogenimonas formicexedens]|uniref:NADH-quinone oxidoreductase subunit E n=1 Tax=Dehalogenimonas formicexedens TaxID=1839801 RepID=A0A1P8F7P7_9CHLR|nr:NADH-quinone oxidoreductase subunit NuoE [Dehalogenimonas formicexedens]APV44478.1 NADH-quinone oxidoreductase subunit E [Dehalogenimonas formicexedens]
MPDDVTQTHFDIDAVLGGFGRDRANLIPVLQAVQQHIGYLSVDAVSSVAEYLGLSETTVHSVASFYTQFKFKPSGKNVIKVCRGTACHVGGGERILAEIERQLGIKPGETTPDLQFTIDTVACIGACALSPVVIVNENIHGRASVNKILEAVAEKKDVAYCRCP